MTRAAQPAIVWLVAVLLVASVSAAAARGGRGGGRGVGGGRAGGGFSGRGPASGGSFGQRGRGTERGGFNGSGPAASGSFAGQVPSSGGHYAGGGTAVGQRDSSAIARERHERLSGLGTPEQREGRQDALGDRQDERQGRRQERREQRRDQAREDWQDYADDYDPGDSGGGYYEWGYYDEYDYAGAAIGAAAATPPYWTLPCTPTPVVIGATTYYQCGSTWYIQAYSGGEVVYTIVNPPVGY